MDYRKFLMDELFRRQKKNRAYSMRAFSRDLGLPSSRLSEILHGKVGLSEEKAVALAQCLKLSEDDTNFFVDLVESEHSRSVLVRKAAAERVRTRMLFANEMSEESLSILSDWYYPAIIELLNVEGLPHSPEAFAEKLEISVELVNGALENLMRLGHIARQNDRFIQTEPDRTTSVDIPSEKIRNYHSMMMTRAQRALEANPVEKRDFSTHVFAMNAEQLAYAKERLQSLRREIVKELEGAQSKDAVYCLSLQLFELRGE